jgi:hypothetical protein
VLGLIEYDWEIGNPDEWFAEVYLPQSVFDELATVCRKGALATFSLRFNTDLWVAEYDQHTPPSGDVTWHLSPCEYGSDVAFLALDDFYWTEKPLVLRPVRGSVEEENLGDDLDAPPSDPEARQKRFEADQLAIAERIRKTLYFVGAMLAVIALVLVLK